MDLKRCSETLSVCKISNAVNILVDKIFDTYKDFGREKLPLSIKHVAILSEIVYIVHNLQCLLKNLDQTDGTFNQVKVQILTNVYSECQNRFYKLKYDIQSMKSHI